MRHVQIEEYKHNIFQKQILSENTLYGIVSNRRWSSDTHMQREAQKERKREPKTARRSPDGREGAMFKSIALASHRL